MMLPRGRSRDLIRRRHVMRARQLAASAVFIIAATVPAFADPVTSEGAKALSDDLAAYFGHEAFNRGILAVVPQGDAFQISFDPNPFLDTLKLRQGDSVHVGRWSL